MATNETPSVERNDVPPVEPNSRCLPKLRVVAAIVRNYFVPATSPPLATPRPPPVTSAVISETIYARRNKNLPPLTLEVDTHPRFLLRDYTVVKEIGHGPYSVVYECIRNGTEHVAVKVIPYLHYERRETRVLRKLKGVEGMLQWIETKIESCKAFVVTSYYAGGDVFTSIVDRHEYNTVQACCDLMMEIIRIVLRLHQSGYVHLDLKFENFVKKEDNTLVLIDFGFARKYTQTLRTTSKCVGTKPYAPPEAFHRYYTAASDVYSLGMMMKLLYETYAMTPPPITNSMLLFEWQDRPNLLEVIYWLGKTRPTEGNVGV